MSGGHSTSTVRSALSSANDPNPDLQITSAACQQAVCMSHMSAHHPSSSALGASRGALPLLGQHSRPPEAHGCRQGAESVHDSSSYPCRSSSITHWLWLLQAVSCHWVTGPAPLHAAFPVPAHVPGRQSPLAHGAKQDRSPSHQRKGRAGCVRRGLEDATGSN